MLKNAFDLYKLVANTGDAVAQYYISLMLWRRLGGSPEYTKSNWLLSISSRSRWLWCTK